MLFAFDKKQNLLRAYGDDELVDMHLNLSINQADELTFTMPSDISVPTNTVYVAVPFPNSNNEYSFQKLISRVDKNDVIQYHAYSFAYQELGTYGYLKDLRPSNRNVEALMHIALLGTPWSLNRCNIGGTYSSNFYYCTPLDAIRKIQEAANGELKFYVTIEGNKITGRYVDYLIEQGQDTGYRFDYGSNLIEVVRTTDVSDVYTAILPRGKGEEIDNGDPNTPDGYGRRILIDDVVWSKSAGQPLDKPKGESILADPVARAKYGQMDGKDRLAIQVFDDIDDPGLLINAAYRWLMAHNHERIEYSAQVADGHQLNLGDRVAIVKHDDKRDLSYRTRVFKIEYDLLNPYNTKLSLGDDLSSSSLINQINRIESSNSKTNEMINWAMQNSDGSHTSYGPNAPDKAKKGDIWYKQLPNGDVEIYRYENGQWTLIIDAATGERVTNEVNKAISDSKAYSDSLDAALKSEISKVNKVANDGIAKANSDIANANANIAKSQQDIADLDIRVSSDFANQQKEIENITANINSLGQVNQLFNSEFTPDLANWYNNASIDDSQRFNGSRVLKIPPTTNYFETSYKQPVYAGLNVGYRVYVKGTSGNKFLVRLQNQISEEISISNVSGTFTGDWQKVERIITVPKGVTKVGFNFTHFETNDAYLSQPMMVFDVKDKIGPYVPGSYNNNEQLVSIQQGLNGLQISVNDNAKNISSVSDKADRISAWVSDVDKKNSAAIQINKDAIAAEVKDRATGDTNTLVQAKDYTRSQITSSEKNTESKMTQTADGILAQLGVINKLSNTEFIPQDWVYPGWHLGDPWSKSQLPVDGTKGLDVASSNFLFKSNYPSETRDMFHADNGDGVNVAPQLWFTSDPILAKPGDKYTVSAAYSIYPNSAVGKGFNLYIKFYDAKHNSLQSVGQSYTSTSWSLATSKATAPIGTAYVAVVVGMAGHVDLAQIMLESGYTHKLYSPGLASLSTVVGIFNDHITTAVSNLNGKISTVDQRVDSITTRVSNAESGLSTLRTQTDSRITQEIKDRQTGDTNTLTSAKNYTISQVSDKATKSEVTQTKDSILATVTWNNLVNNSEFKVADDGTIYGWHQEAWGAPIKTGANSFIHYNDEFYLSSNYAGKTAAMVRNKFGTSQSENAPIAWMDSDAVAANPGEIYSASVANFIHATGTPNAVFVIYIRAFNSSKQELNKWRASTNEVNNRKVISVTTEALPTGTAYVSLRIVTAGWVSFSQPMMVLGASVDGYAKNESGINAALAIFNDNFSLGIRSHTGDLISGINADTNGLVINGKKIAINGDTTVGGDFWAKQVNAVKVNAGNIVAGTLDANKINVVNIDANNITGNRTQFFQSMWGSTYGNSVEITAGQIEVKFPQLYTNSTKIYLHGLVSMVGGVYKGGVEYGGNEYSNGGTGYMINLRDGKNNSTGFVIEEDANKPRLPALTWNGFNIGSITLGNGIKVKNPGGWLMSDNLTISTWDNTDTLINFDQTTRTYIKSNQFEIGQTDVNNSYRYMKVTMLTKDNAIGFSYGSGIDSGVFVGNTGDVWFSVKGQLVSMYAIAQKLSLI